jgi:hypothetical protein
LVGGAYSAYPILASRDSARSQYLHNNLSKERESHFCAKHNHLRRDNIGGVAPVPNYLPAQLQKERHYHAFSHL